MSTPPSFEPLSPDAYDRAKKVFDRAKHPGFVGRELFFRCATRGKAVLAVVDGVDVGVALISEADKLQALSVIVKAQGAGIGAAIVRHLRPKYVSALGEKTAWFERLGYRASGAPRIGRDKAHTVQLMEFDPEASAAPSPEASAAPSPEASAAPSPEASATIQPWDCPLMDWIPKCDSRWKSPYHLADFVNALERAPRGAVRCVEAVPIRHFKTITLVCAIAWWLARDPTLRVVYMTYSTHRATEIGKTIRDTCRRMDVRIASGYDTIARWSTPQGGGVAVMSADQSHLGADIDILVWDDPIESFVEVDKPEVRQRVDETIAFYTNRLNVSGSCIGIMSPMHLDDPLHRRLRRKSPPWESFIHPAIIDEDLPTERAFAPEVRSLEQIRAAKAELHESDPSDRIFLAQWMCSPITPRGDHFTNPARYRELPTFGGSRVFYGLDMSYSQATISDWSAIVVFKAWGSTAYVQHVDRFRLDVPLIGHKLLTAQSRYGTGPIFSYVSGPEIGIIQHLAERGLPVEGMPARYNKLVRATRTIRRVRESEILFPEDDAAAWVPSMIQRLTSWRGVDGDEDDEVDALVSGSEGGMFSFAGSEPTTTSGERRFQSTF